jgi:phosphoglycolate phosphatase-like HAD superfamily hydrolase
MLRIITDFDGPIMDVSERYYRVYQHCLKQIGNPNQSIQLLTKQEFWELKRSQVPERQIGLLSGLDEQQAQMFAQLRRQTVHTLPYLSYDTLKPEALPVLEYLQQTGVDLVVMTMRRVQELHEAFERYDLARFFPPARRYCLSNDYVKTTDVEDKPLLMQRALSELPPATDTWMIGDTEADIVAAKRYGIKVIGVLCGIRNYTQLIQYQPDRIADNFAQAVEVITSRSPEYAIL